MVVFGVRLSGDRKRVKRGGGFQSRMAEWATWHPVKSAGCVSEKHNCVSTSGH